MLKRYDTKKWLVEENEDELTQREVSTQTKYTWRDREKQVQHIRVGQTITGVGKTQDRKWDLKQQRKVSDTKIKQETL